MYIYIIWNASEMVGVNLWFSGVHPNVCALIGSHHWGLTISWSAFLRAKHGFGQVKSVSWGALAVLFLRKTWGVDGFSQILVTEKNVMFGSPGWDKSWLKEGCDFSIRCLLSGTAPAAWIQYFFLMRWWTPCGSGPRQAEFQGCHPCVGGLQRSAQQYLGIVNKQLELVNLCRIWSQCDGDSGEVLCVQVGGIR